MIIHTVIGNRAHPEYGVASIPFPIPTEEYPRIIEMLEALEGNITATLCLPASEVQIDRVLERCSIQADEFYSLHIVGSSFGVEIEEYLNAKYETIQSLNSMCEAAAGISTEKLGAIIRSTSPESTEPCQQP